MSSDITDVMVAHGAGQANMQLQQMLEAVAPLFKQAEQVIQQKMPKPGLPPNEQAALQIAGMENQRKTALDQATMAMSKEKMAAEERLRQMEAAAAQQKQAFEQYMAQMESDATARNEELTKQVDILKNEADNRQHQTTELLKNNQDNQTAILIKRMELLQGQVQGVAEKQDATPPAADTMKPLIEAMTQQLGGLAEAHTKSSETHAQSMEKLHKHLTAPKRLVKDPVTGEKRVEVVSVPDGQ